MLRTSRGAEGRRRPPIISKVGNAYKYKICKIWTSADFAYHRSIFVHIFAYFYSIFLHIESIFLHIYAYILHMYAYFYAFFLHISTYCAYLYCILKLVLCKCGPGASAAEPPARSDLLPAQAADPVASAADSAAGDVRPMARSSRGPGGVGRRLSCRRRSKGKLERLVRARGRRPVPHSSLSSLLPLPFRALLLPQSTPLPSMFVPLDKQDSI